MSGEEILTLAAARSQTPGDFERAFEATCVVTSNRPVTGEYRLLVVEAPAGSLDCRAGQFFHIQCPVRDAAGPYLRRPMSIYGYDREAGELSFLYKVTGTGTAALATLAPGETMALLGPLGRGFDIRHNWNRLVLVARGVGLATLAPLAQEARRLGCSLTAICSARTPDLLMSTGYFAGLGAEVVTITDSEGTSDMDSLWRLIEGLIESRPGGRGVDAFYTCGSNRILKLLQAVGKAHGIPGQVALEQQMACGLGMCQCCVRPFRVGDRVVHRRVCREGPVFDMQEALGW